MFHLPNLVVGSIRERTNPVGNAEIIPPLKKQDEFDQTWEMLNVMVGLLKTDYEAEDLSYEKAAPTVGVGGPVRVFAEPPGTDSY